MSVLSANEIDERLPSMPDWQLKNGELARTFTFGDFTKTGLTGRERNKVCVEFQIVNFACKKISVFGFRISLQKNS